MKLYVITGILPLTGERVRCSLPTGRNSCREMLNSIEGSDYLDLKIEEWKDENQLLLKFTE